MKKEPFLFFLSESLGVDMWRVSPSLFPGAADGGGGGLDDDGPDGVQDALLAPGGRPPLAAAQALSAVGGTDLRPGGIQ